MAKASIVAEPYGKAVFETALAAKTLSQWSALLQLLSQAVQTPACQQILANPETTLQQRLALMRAVADKGLDDQGANFIALLAERKRLALLAAIVDCFHEFYREHEKTTDVRLTSAQPLSDEMLKQFEQTLEKRVNEKVRLSYQQDPDLLGGAVIEIGDLVIDGSLRGKLSKMAVELVG